VESVLTRTEAIEHIIAGCVSSMDRSALVPIPAVDVNGIGHAKASMSPMRKNSGDSQYIT
jgi:hypothetical protein